GGRVGGFVAAVRGARIAAVTRRAKFIRMDLERAGRPAGALLCHLRMTGRLHVEPRAAPAGDYARVVLGLDDGRALHFDDVRKFGRLTFVEDPARALRGLGPEPLEPPFGPAWLAGALAARRRALKPLLLDQAFLAGLGNIYVDESLHRAGLHPLRRADRVRPEEAARLAGEIRAVLERAIAREGASFDTFYRTPEGREGGFQHEFRVYDRAGEPCTACATPIVRIVVGQRGTHFCPACQPRRPARAHPARGGRVPASRAPSAPAAAPRRRR
ncbi:MAG: bifunctional DNA-formamidopyrimidine glycosylase/DNA-(apurinic or apyrimidinic site) lyase, partial [Planctomycetia bacterium]